MVQESLKVYRLVIFLALAVSFVSGVCIHLDLGMEKGVISDSKITASSELNAGTPAKNGRLNYVAGPSWCAQTNDNNPYLQIDLQSLHVICAVSTQGNSKADEWVETYTLQISTDGLHWTDYDNDGHPKIFFGNNDRNSEAKAILGVITRWLRIVGKTKHNKFCMRAELFGVKRNPENLALMKVAAQSTTHNVSSGAENAVDGNRNPLFDVNGNCALTNQGNPSWWRVDLGTNRVPVSDVFIVNRLFPPSAQQTNGDYTITLGDDSNVDRNLACNGLVQFKDFIASSVCYTNPLKTGRYIGILTTGRSILSLCEVEVYSRENLAFNKSTKMIGGPPFKPGSRAVDGKSQTSMGQFCTHTEAGGAYKNPWFRVDLGQVEPVNEVYIVNRGDCCGDRLNPFEIRVGTASSDNGITNPLCGSGLSVPSGAGASFFCRPALFGQYVTIRVTKNGNFPIHICEIEVYSARRACQMQAFGVTSDKTIPSGRLSATSSRTGFEPEKGRLHGDGAWSPSDKNNRNDFLQIDLQYEFFICAVATQGHPSNDFWTTKYKLLFSVNDIDWLTYKEKEKEKIFNGNSGREEVVKHSLMSFTRVRFVRFQPTEFNNEKALRVEIYGVPVPAGPNQSPSNFNLSPVNSTSVFASWKLPPARSIQGIKLLYKIKNTEYPFTTSTIAGDSTTSTIITGLGKFTEYEFHVLAFTASGNGPLSPVQVVRTNEDVPCEGPKGISFDEVNQTTYKISWAPLAREKWNGIIIGHEIKHEKASTEIRSKPSIGNTTYSNSANSFALVTGFQPGCNYSISVRAFTSVGGGPFGEKKTLITSNSVPPYWEVKTITRTEVELNWINPSLRPTEVFNYMFTYSGTEDYTKEFYDDGSVNLGRPPSERYTVTCLVPDTFYKFYFNGISSCGQSLSQIIEAKTIASG